MDPMTIAAIMAGIGMLKGELLDKPEAERAKKSAMQQEALKTAFSPYLGSTPGDISQIVTQKGPDSLQQGIDYGLIGASMGQGLGGQSSPEASAQPQRRRFSRREVDQGISYSRPQGRYGDFGSGGMA